MEKNDYANFFGLSEKDTEKLLEKYKGARCKYFEKRNVLFPDGTETKIEVLCLSYSVCKKYYLDKEQHEYHDGFKNKLLPIGYEQCPVCGKIARLESMTKIYNNESLGLDTYDICADCLHELTDDFVVAKCIDGKYYMKYTRYNGQYLPFEVYQAYKCGNELPEWWNIEH